MNETKMTKNIIDSVNAFAEPIDFKKLIDDGVLILKGQSFYVKSLKDLPEKVAKRLKSAEPGRYGIQVVFYKETKSMKNLAGKLNTLRK